ncbi:MAG: hypothetical protein NZ733_00950 [Aigarchaeota archaeon]|nr:hypothetical protein [Aigarchaeota archaeon]MDW8044024.1 hypothetical protein [Nitrososphaerota archaeon]
MLNFYYRRGCKTCATVREQLELKEVEPPEDLIGALIEGRGRRGSSGRGRSHRSRLRPRSSWPNSPRR